MSDHTAAVSARRLDRRAFLGLGAMATAAALVPGRAAGAERLTGAPLPTDRALSFVNTHTGERLQAVYCCGGRYEPAALAQINHILRDVRRNEVKPIDVKLLDLLHELGGALQTAQPFHVISGYRSPLTNAALRAHGGAATGVATQSLHMVGKAIDIRVPGVRLDRLRDTARSLGRGGVGYYPASDFVHVDTGRVRQW